MACSGQAFHEWVTENKLAQSANLEELRGAQLAIDADDYLDRLLTDASTREPLLPALGGLPMALKKHINSHIEVLVEHEITPRFVFGGLDIAIRDRGVISSEARRTSTSLGEAWNLYGQGDADAAVEEFGKSCTYRCDNLRRWLTQYLIKQGHSSLLAPYSAAAQMVYWKNDLGKNADALVGSADLLLFGADKIIVAFDWEAKTFTWTSAELIRNKLNLRQDQLIDVCLLSGLTLLSPLDEIIDTSQPPLEAARIAMARANNDGLTTCIMSKNEAYTSAFKKAKVAVKHMPVAQAGGKIEPLHYSGVYDNLHECISQRLPDEVLYYCMRGFIDPKFLNIRTQMELYETAPLDGGTSNTYQDLVQQKLTPLRRQALAVLSHRLHRYYARKDVVLVTWFNETSTASVGVPEAITAMSKSAEQWQVPQSTLESLSGYEKTNALPITSLLTVLSDPQIPPKTISRNSSPGALKTSTEFLANSLWRFLQGRGYIDADHGLTSWGKAYVAALEHADSSGYLELAATPAEAEEAIFLALELLRMDLLDGTPMFTSPLYTGAPHRGSEADKANTNLISRVACLATFQHRELGFTGPLSRHLLAYHQITARVRDSLRNLLETYTVDMLMSGVFSRELSPKQWSEYGAQLPLLKEPDLGLALVVKSYLDELSNEAARRADITRWFPQALDVHADLKMAWKLWESVNVGVQAAEEVSASTKANFGIAEQWLKQKLAQAAIPMTNGST